MFGRVQPVYERLDSEDLVERTMGRLIYTRSGLLQGRIHFLSEFFEPELKGSAIRIEESFKFKFSYFY